MELLLHWGLLFLLVCVLGMSLAILGSMLMCRFGAVWLLLAVGVYV